jgi:hypothetical protein
MCNRSKMLQGLLRHGSDQTLDKLVEGIDQL